MATCVSAVLPDLGDLSQPHEFCDVSLVLEGRKLYTSRGFLASVSPVWRQMFTGNFKESKAKQIALPGKKCEDVRELLLCLTTKHVTGKAIGICLLYPTIILCRPT